MYCVYKHTNKINNKIYIGQTCQKPEYRWGSDGQNYKNNPYFYSAIIKYGWNNFTHEIIYNNLTAEEANQKEIELIKLYIILLIVIMVIIVKAAARIKFLIKKQETNNLIQHGKDQ